jgi:hypothetical protein
VRWIARVGCALDLEYPHAVPVLVEMATGSRARPESAIVLVSKADNVSTGSLVEARVVRLLPRRVALPDSAGSVRPTAGLQPLCRCHVYPKCTKAPHLILASSASPACRLATASNPRYPAMRVVPLQRLILRSDSLQLNSNEALYGRSKITDWAYQL